MTNQEIADLLRSVAAAYTIKGKNRFRIMAYENAADSVEHAGSELKDIWEEGKLTEVPGIGANIAQHLDELFRTGEVRQFDRAKKGLPPAMFELMKISGIGVKTAFRLCKELKINDPSAAVEALISKAGAGKIAPLEGFGDKSEKEILREAKRYLGKQEIPPRMLLPSADRQAESVIDYLKEGGKVGRADVLGSLRRQTALVGDVDLSVATTHPEEVLSRFLKFPKTSRVIEKGSVSASILLEGGTQVDLRVHSPEAYGSLLQHFTGSKLHNIKLREMAQKKGLSLSEYGIKIAGKSKKTAKIHRFKSEVDFYQFLGMAWIPPELRENSGEIEAALREFQGRRPGLPRLVKFGDVKGDLHVHSNFPIESSHDLGESSLEKMVAQARAMGFEYLGLTEHNPSLRHHREDQVVKIVKRKKAMIDEFNYSNTNLPRKFEKGLDKHGKSNGEERLSFHVFNGLEVDIRPDGELALPAEAFEYLDYVIASVHSSFNLGKKQMTERVLRGLGHPKVKILGHPTGRKLNLRESFELDWEKIFAFCLKSKKALEINAWPDRLDLPDYLVREAVKNGVKMIINSDAHQREDLELIKYGVSVARRGWAEKKDILNTLKCDKMAEALGLKLF